MTDEAIALSPDVRLTVGRLEALKKVSGLSFGQCLSADDEIRFRALAFLELYRRDMAAGGTRPDPDDLWERAAEVEIYVGGEPERLGPTSEGP